MMQGLLGKILRYNVYILLIISIFSLHFALKLGFLSQKYLIKLMISSTIMRVVA
jgi:hypothetical protein